MPIPKTRGILRTKIEDMEIGDYIIFGYITGSITIFEVGTSTRIEMPVTGNGQGSGKTESAYFVKVSKGLLISDRICAHTVTWDLLNSSKNIQGKPTTLGINPVNGVIRSLTGGVAYADANGNAVIAPNANSYKFPSNNEFDKYIVNSNLNGTVAPNDDNVWHHVDVFTWCQDTPMLSLGASNLRVSRASNLNTGVTKGFGIPLSSTADVRGFRPVFEYNENQFVK